MRGAQLTKLFPISQEYSIQYRLLYWRIKRADRYAKRSECMKWSLRSIVWNLVARQNGIQSASIQ